MGQSQMPSAVTYDSPFVIQDQPGENGRVLYAFVRGEDGHLYRNFWSGKEWNWVDHGSPQNIGVSSAPSAISTTQWWGRLQNAGSVIDVFARANDLNLYRMTGDGDYWEWDPLGQPQAPLTGKPAATEYWRLLDGELRDATALIYVFGRDVDGELQLSFFDGNIWAWFLHGFPSEHVSVADDPGVAVYDFGGRRKLYTFVTGSDGHLHVHIGDGANKRDGDGMNWEWADQNLPSQDNRGPGTQTVAGTPAATVWTPNRPNAELVQGDTMLLAFVRGTDGHLYRNYWNGQTWVWFDHQMPQNSDTHQNTSVGDPAVALYEYNGLLRPYVFVRGDDGHLYSNTWNGQNWVWFDHQTPQNSATHQNTDVGDPSVASYTHDGYPTLYVFARGRDGNLYASYWDGQKWQWRDQNSH